MSCSGGQFRSMVSHLCIKWGGARTVGGTERLWRRMRYYPGLPKRSERTRSGRLKKTAHQRTGRNMRKIGYVQTLYSL